MDPSPIIRLQRSSHIDLWHTFELRCRNFVARYNTSGLTVPIHAIMDEMLQRWIVHPDLCGYFLSADLSSHLASWLHNYYGQTRLFIWQAESEAKESLLEPLIVRLKIWLDHTNSQLPPQAQCHRATWLTWHPEKIWRRYLKKLKLEPLQSHTEIEMAI